MKEIKLKIKKYRELKELSLGELAKKTGLSKSYLSEIENGKKVCSLKILYKIGNTLNICPALLIDCPQNCRQCSLMLKCF